MDAASKDRNTATKLMLWLKLGILVVSLGLCGLLLIAPRLDQGALKLVSLTLFALFFGIGAYAAIASVILLIVNRKQ